MTKNRDALCHLHLSLRYIPVLCVHTVRWYCAAKGEDKASPHSPSTFTSTIYARYNQLIWNMLLKSFLNKNKCNFWYLNLNWCLSRHCLLARHFKLFVSQCHWQHWFDQLGLRKKAKKFSLHGYLVLWLTLDRQSPYFLQTGSPWSPPFPNSIFSAGPYLKILVFITFLVIV